MMHAISSSLIEGPRAATALGDVDPIAMAMAYAKGQRAVVLIMTGPLELSV
jgi:hypothetical protein